MEINGIAHTFLTSGDFPVARAFYSRLLPALGLTPVMDGDGFYYCVGGRTALGIRASEDQGADNRFDQNRAGLHHLCFRMRNREDVDELHALLLEMGATIIHPPQEDGWAQIRWTTHSFHSVAIWTRVAGKKRRKVNATLRKKK